MSETIYLATICLPLGTILLIFAMRSWSATQQAKARFAHDEAYRQIAEKAVTAESHNAMALAAIQAALGDVGVRLIAIEKILKAVE
jgi:hypothetical protein